MSTQTPSQSFCCSGHSNGSGPLPEEAPEPPAPGVLLPPMLEPAEDIAPWAPVPFPAVRLPLEVAPSPSSPPAPKVLLPPMPKPAEESGPRAPVPFPAVRRPPEVASAPSPPLPPVSPYSYFPSVMLQDTTTSPTKSRHEKRKATGVCFTAFGSTVSNSDDNPRDAARAGLALPSLRAMPSDLPTRYTHSPLHPDHLSGLALLRAVGKQNAEGSPRARPRSDAEQAAVEVALELTPHERWQRRSLETGRHCGGVTP
jgi:hypothetical protein